MVCVLRLITPQAPCARINNNLTISPPWNCCCCWCCSARQVWYDWVSVRAIQSTERTHNVPNQNTWNDCKQHAYSHRSATSTLGQMHFCTPPNLAKPMMLLINPIPHRQFLNDCRRDGCFFFLLLLFFMWWMPLRFEDNNNNWITVVR